jgi:hypothetical protein
VSWAVEEEKKEEQEKKEWFVFLGGVSQKIDP